MKKAISLFLALMLCVSLAVPALGAEIVDSGICGENLTWTLDSDGVLTVSGTGEMDDYKPMVALEFYDTYDYNKPPWDSHSADIFTVIIEDGVSRIGGFAFYDYSNLMSVSIPESVTSFGTAAFWNVPWIKTLGEFAIVNQWLLWYNGEGGEDVIIPYGVTVIGGLAFPAGFMVLNNPIKMNRVIIPDSVTRIEDYAFGYCGLKNVIIPDSVTSIGTNAFDFCGDLMRADIPDSVTNIGPAAFAYCGSLQYVSIGSGVTHLGDGMFLFCNSLRSISIPASVSSVGYWTFAYCPLEDIYYGGGEEQWNAIRYKSPGGSEISFEEYESEYDKPYFGDTAIHYYSTGPTVEATAQTVTVNGSPVTTEAYNIDGYNYFKLRDLAYMLSGTSAQFSVGYDDATATISVTTGEAYAPVGGEMAAGTDNSASCEISAQTLLVDGERVSLTAYNIGGYNFFKLRDLGEALGFGVDYDEASDTAVIGAWYIGDEMEFLLVKETLIYSNGVRRITEYEYDNAGNLTKETGPAFYGHEEYTYEYEYDDMGNLTKESYSVTNGYSHTYEYEYDGAGNLTKEAYSNSRGYSCSYDYEYDNAANLTKETHNNSFDESITTEYEYDEAGNLTKEMYSHSNGSSYTCEYEYDDAGNLTKETYNSPLDGSYTEYRYDAGGSEIGDYNIPKRFTTTEYEYDDAGNLTKETCRDSRGGYWSYDYECEYDDAGNLIRETRHHFDDSPYTYEYEYDDVGNLTKKTYSYKDYFDTTEYEYDGAGNLIKETYNGYYSYTDEYEYDDAGNLTKKAHSNSDGQSWSYDYEYDNAANLIKETYNYYFTDHGDYHITTYEYIAI